MAHVRMASLRNGIVVETYVNDMVQVESDKFGNVVKLLEVEFASADKGRQGERSEIAHGHLFG